MPSRVWGAHVTSWCVWANPRERQRGKTVGLEGVTTFPRLTSCSAFLTNSSLGLLDLSVQSLATPASGKNSRLLWINRWQHREAAGLQSVRGKESRLKWPGRDSPLKWALRTADQGCLADQQATCSSPTEKGAPAEKRANHSHEWNESCLQRLRKRQHCTIYVNVPFKGIFSRGNFGADTMKNNPV